MTPAGSTGAALRGPLSSAPLVWAVTLACTLLLLVFLQQMLWLVLPFLLAVLMVYLLAPAARQLMRRGVARESAAAIVAGTAFIAGVAAMVPTASWLAAQSVAGEQAFLRYFDAARALMAQTLGLLASQFRFLERMDLQGLLDRQLEQFGSSYFQEHLASALLAAAAWLPALLLAPFLASFILRDGQRFLKFLSAAVPNAYFERTLHMVERLDGTARAYFQGLMKLTLIDAACLGFGLVVLGIPHALLLGLVCAVLAWVPIVGSIVGCIVVVLVAATDVPGEPGIVYAAIGLFIVVRLLDDFVFMPLTIGRSLQLHPVPMVLLIFVGGAVAGIPGLVLAPPLAGVVMVVVDTVIGIFADPRLRARHAFAKALRVRRVTDDLRP